MLISSLGTDFGISWKELVVETLLTLNGATLTTKLNQELAD